MDPRTPPPQNSHRGIAGLLGRNRISDGGKLTIGTLSHRTKCVSAHTNFLVKVYEDLPSALFFYIDKGSSREQLIPFQTANNALDSSEATTHRLAVVLETAVAAESEDNITQKGESLSLSSL
ncbi:hypothetical protein EVAR_66458_1 [Eumeta japonica]|uniref:Uncharacterized protein n=1 Tax=Eumeta variegata TaxID=151549 RepID=A0A4C1ZVJ4_EUMVA|nr:hypothetical protein EVAR_66458_1 [Eumeta japonica]